MRTLFETGLTMEVNYANGSDDMDHQKNLHVNGGAATFDFTLHSKPTVKLARLGEFNEVECVHVKGMPRNYLDQCDAWNTALREVCRQCKHAGWVVMRLPHTSHLIDIVLSQGFFPAVDDEGIELVLKYMPRSNGELQLDATHKVMECLCEFGAVQLHQADQRQELASCKYKKQNVGLDMISPLCREMPILTIHVAMDAVKGVGCAPFRPYFQVVRMLTSITRSTFGTKLVGVITKNRYEEMACLEAGFFPLVSETADMPQMFIRVF